MAAPTNLVLSIRVRPEAEVQAEALRDAANALYSDNGPENPIEPGSCATWLHNRADALEQK